MNIGRGALTNTWCLAKIGIFTIEFTIVLFLCLSLFDTIFFSLCMHCIVWVVPVDFFSVISVLPFLNFCITEMLVSLLKFQMGLSINISITNFLTTSLVSKSGWDKVIIAFYNYTSLGSFSPGGYTFDNG